jgi:membrane fusion protein (multidrug efflux system)
MPEGRKNAVFVLDESATPPVLEHREIEIGQRRAGEVEVITGLRKGEKVVTRGKMMAASGTPVQVTAMATGDGTLRDLLDQKSESTP